MTFPFKKSDLPEVERRHRYLISVFGPDKAHEVIMHTKEMYLTMHDLNIAKEWIVENELPPESVVQSLTIASISYLGYTSDSEFGIKEVADGEPVEK